MKIFIGIVAIILLPFVIYYLNIGLRFAGVINGSTIAPSEIEVGRTIAYGPGCAGFWCSGGTVYALGSETAAKIKTEGLEFFQGITRVERGDRLNKGWEKCPPFTYSSDRASSHCKYLASISSPNFGDIESFNAAISSETYYVGIGAGSQLRIIIAPEAALVFIGWSD